MPCRTTGPVTSVSEQAQVISRISESAHVLEDVLAGQGSAGATGVASAVGATGATGAVGSAGAGRGHGRDGTAVAGDLERSDIVCAERCRVVQRDQLHQYRNGPRSSAG